MGQPLRKSIRVNTLKISVKEFQKLATKLHWQLTPVPWCPAGFWLERDSHATPLGKTWLYAAGLFYIQEAASMLPPELLLGGQATLGNIAYENLDFFTLDVAAAPGSKTTQLAALQQNSGVIIANEPSLKRIKSLSHNLELAGVGNALLARKDGSAFEKYFPNQFDRILLDAPCTGEGTARKDPRALTRWSLGRIQAMADLQKRLLVSAFHALKAEGELVYSTCTFAPEENEAVVDYLLQQFPEVAEVVPAKNSNGLTEFEKQKYHSSLTGCRRLWPHRDHCEGFFAAKVRKLAPTKSKIIPAIKRSATSPFTPVPTKRALELVNQMGKYFGCQVELPQNYTLFTRDNELWLRPFRIEKWASRFSFERTGTRIVKLNRTGEIIRLTHLGAGLLLRAATQQIVELGERELDEYLGGRDFEISPTSKVKDGQVILRYAGQYLGLGLLREKMKNLGASSQVSSPVRPFTSGESWTHSHSKLREFQPEHRFALPSFVIKNQLPRDFIIA